MVVYVNDGGTRLAYDTEAGEYVLVGDLSGKAVPLRDCSLLPAEHDGPPTHEEVRVFITETRSIINDHIRGRWWESNDGRLYIFPRGRHKLYGPDDDTAEALVAMESEYDHYIPDEEVAKLGLTLVPFWLRRYNVIDGYYNSGREKGGE